jgi:hypothetical protein
MYVHNFPELSSNDFLESRINKFISVNNIPTSLGGVIQWKNIDDSDIITYDCLTFLKTKINADSDMKVYFSETKLDKEFSLDLKSFLEKFDKILAHFDDLYIYIEDEIFVEISTKTHYINLSLRLKEKKNTFFD